MRRSSASSSRRTLTSSPPVAKKTPFLKLQVISRIFIPLKFLTQIKPLNLGLPENVEVEKMASLLSHDGILSIEAPLKRSNVEKATKEPKEIPISRSVAKEDNPKK